jgi:hypothetical protein
MTRQPNLDAQRVPLATFAPDKLGRFGGRYRVVFGGLYRVARECVVSLLNSWGDIQDDRSDEELFTAAAGHLPPGSPLVTEIQMLGQLGPFRYGTQPEPFDPVGPQARATAEVSWKQAKTLLDHAVEVHRERGTVR